MAWNPSPKVAAARDIGNKFNYDQVIVIGINLAEGTHETITYGKTVKLCNNARMLGSAAAAGMVRSMLDAIDRNYCQFDEKS